MSQENLRPGYGVLAERFCSPCEIEAELEEESGTLGVNALAMMTKLRMAFCSPAIEQQATDRAYRMGQRQNVTVYYLIATGTIEEKILRLHDTKRQLADSLCVSYVWLSNLYQSKLLDFYRGLELAF